MRKGLFRRINESEARLKTGKLYDEQAFGNCSKPTDFEVKSNDLGFDQYEDSVYDPEAFTGSPYNEILEAAGVKKPSYDLQFTKVEENSTCTKKIPRTLGIHFVFFSFYIQSGAAIGTSL